MCKKNNDRPLDRVDLSLFLFTTDTYFRLAKDLPVNSGLASIGDAFPDAVLACPYTEEDYVGIVTRLVLQRKYFAPDDRVHLRNLLAYARDELLQCADEIGRICSYLDEVNQRFRLSFPDGSERNGLWRSVEPILYGDLLHADRDKADLLLQLTESEWMLFTCPFVLGREKALEQFRELLLREGIRPYAVEVQDRATVICWGETVDVQQAVTGSPYWANLAGRDASEDEIIEALNGLDETDAEVLTVCMGFFAMLRAERTNYRTLRKSVVWWTRKDLGDFSEAISYVRSIDNPGFSSKVRYYNNGAMATVRVWPKVVSNILIEHPQVTEQIEIRAIRFFGKWKVHSIGGCISESLKPKGSSQ